MQRIYAIALTSVREAIRDRVLFAVLGLGALSVFFGLGLGALSLAEATRILVDHGLVTLSLLSNLVAIFLGVNFLYKELELRTLHVLLARPVARHEVLLGKFLGIWLTVAVFVFTTATLLFALLLLTATDESAAAAERAHALLGVPLEFRYSLRARALALGGVTLVALLPLAIARVRRALSVGAVLPVSALGCGAMFLLARVVVPGEAHYLAAGMALVLAEVTVTASFSMLFSAFSTPFVTGMFSVGTFVLARSTWLMQHIRMNRFPEALKALLKGVAWVLPNLHLFVPSRPSLIPDDPHHPALGYVLQCSLYGASYAALLLLAAALVFRRRDLT
ncbi:MAG: ABC transporter permease [Deltaproteobacteria bacterium]|nr:ABC transporter permease [Deltaproteobacteria bacterium]